jgi:hypothetical protein
MSKRIFSILLGSITLFAFFTAWYTPLIISLLIVLLAMILFKLGDGIVLLEVTAFLYVFTCLAMPLMGYNFYTVDNTMARLWVGFMPVNANVYFSYTLPATSLFCFVLTLPSLRKKVSDAGGQMAASIERIKLKLLGSPGKGLHIMMVGILVFFVAKYLPAAFNYFAILFFFGSFAGLLYVYFSPSFRHKKLVLLLFALFIMATAVQSGMFTVVAYMSITIFSFFQVGSKVSMLKKVVFMLVGISFFIVLQNVKGVYRKQTWGKEYEGSKTELFANLFYSNLQKGDALLSDKAFFPIYRRANQGFNIALVMRRIPRIEPHDNGKRLLTVFASAFVPRFLWADKPEAGGKFNMKYYAGWQIRGWSTNVGPLGEAYGSFGVVGATIYMFFLAVFLRWVYFRVFALSAKIPLLICWLPVIFYDVTSSAETDTLQIVNSIVKSAFFIWLLIRVLPHWFGNQNIQALKKRRLENNEPLSPIIS